MWAINALLQKTHLTSPPKKEEKDQKTDTDTDTDEHEIKHTSSSSSSSSSSSTLSTADRIAAEQRLAAAREAWQQQHFQSQTTSTSPNKQKTTSPNKQTPNKQQTQQQQQEVDDDDDDPNIQDGEEIARTNVIFSLLAADGQIHVKEPNAILLVHHVSEYDYVLSIISGPRPLVSCPLSSGSRLSFDPVAHTLVFTLCIQHDDLLVVQAFHIRYRDLEQEITTNRIIQQAIVEHQHQMPFQKAVQARDSAWLYSAFDDAPHGERDEKSMDEMEWEDTPHGVINTRKTLGPQASNTTREEEEEEEEEEEDDEEEEEHSKEKRRITSSYTPVAKRSQTHNSQLAVGIVENRTFVGRGTALGVFSHDADGILQYLNRIPTVRTRDGDAFVPTQLMLQQQDQHMCMLNTEKGNTVYDMDLQRGEIVQEYGVSDDFAIRHIAAPSKYGESNTDTTVAGVNKNTLFSLDPRINTKSKLAHKFQYAASPGMTCLATTGDGHIAVGSEKGEIRMFSQIGQKAKTLLPGLGDSILSLDVTEDGAWILATTRRYLMVVPTELSTGKTGFTTPMGNQEKPAPIKLQLDPRDLLKYNITDVSFSAARFNTGASISERWIVTSTGPYLITWNFTSVKKNIRNDYTIKRCQQQVVADQFLYGKENQLIVTEQDNVYLQHTKNKNKK